MKIKQFSIFNPENLEESLQQGEYYIWTVHFADGSSQKVKITSDELTQADLEKHFGKPVKNIDYNWGIQGGGMSNDSNFTRQYHRDQDRIEQQKRDSDATRNEFDEEETPVDHDRRRDEWRKKAPLNDPTKPDRKEYAPFNHDEWMSTSKKMEGAHQNTIAAIANTSEMPVVGDTIRTRKMQMEGKVEKIGQNRAGYDEVYFRVADGRLMKTPVSNAIVIQKLADEDHAMMEADSADSIRVKIHNITRKIQQIVQDGGKVGLGDPLTHELARLRNQLKKMTSKKIKEDELNEISNALLTKYKSGAGKAASAADAMGDIKTGNKRFSGIIKATSKQFANDAKQSPTMKEGMMGGLNRCAPAVDVSYEKVLDRNPETKHSRVVGEDEVLDEVASKWLEEQDLNELSVDTLKDYASKARSTKPEHDRVKTVNHVRGYHKANNRIASKTGDKRQGPMYEKFDSNDFADILNKQHADDQAAKPKPATKEIPYHNWKIRYRPAAQAGDKVAWQVMDKNGEIKHKGESMSDKEAVGAAEEWINQGGGTKQTSNSNVTIDFNVDFAKQFAPGGEQFHASIDTDKGVPILILSTMPQKGLKNSHIRTQADKTTSGTTRLPVITMSAKEANASGLQPNGRYILGDKDPIDNDTAMFPLIYQGTVQGKGDMMKLGKPGLTVAHPREAMHESGTLSGMEEVPFSELVRDTIATHGLRWAVEYYVKKHKIPAKQFRIYAGI